MDIYCVGTGQDERGRSVIVQKKPIEPVTLAQFPGCAFSVSVSPGSQTVQSLRATFSIGFKLVLVGGCFGHLVEIPVAAGSCSGPTSSP